MEVFCMSFEIFKARVSKIASAGGVPVHVEHDADTGRHTARCGDVTIMGNTTSKVAEVRWGANHVAHSTLEVQ